MGCRNREFSEDETTSSTLSEALLFATMCLIGLPVEVHIKDGSVYSGIFHTACVENQYGVVLKKARMTKKGKRNVNVDDGVVIDTLIVLSCDLVQVVATEVLLPAGSFSKSLAGCDNEAMVRDPTSLLTEKEARTCVDSFKEGSLNQTSDLVQDQNGFAHGSLPIVTGKLSDVRQPLRGNIEHNQEDTQHKRGRINCIKLEDVSDAAINWRQDPDNQLKKEQDDHGQEFDLHKGVNVDRVQSSTSSEKPCTEKPISANTTTNAFSVGVSTSSLSSVDSSMDSCRSSIPSTTDMAPSHGSESNKSGKEFKLNPRAKLFSPSVANSMSVTPAAPVAANVAYISNNSPIVPVPVAQPELEFSPFVPRSSMPAAKFVPFGNSIAGFGGNVAQFSQPMVGHVGHAGTRTQPLRYVGQYPLQAGPTFGPPNSPAVMVGRFGQLVYMQPFAHDLAQGTTVVSPVPPCPLLTQPAQYPKHQGTAATQALQFCVPPPFMAGGHQPLAQPLAAVPNHIPFLQPSFSLNRPMPVPVPPPNAFFGTKF